MVPILNTGEIILAKPFILRMLHMQFVQLANGFCQDSTSMNASIFPLT